MSSDVLPVFRRASCVNVVAVAAGGVAVLGVVSVIVILLSPLLGWPLDMFEEFVLLLLSMALLREALLSESNRASRVPLVEFQS